MNICIWYQTTEGPWGGGNSFLRTLARRLTQMGHQVTDVPSQTVDVVLANSWTAGSNGKRLSPGQVAAVRATGKISRWAPLLPLSVWGRLKRSGPAIVHRVDGVAKLFRGHGGKADEAQFAISPLADYTIFQSRYCEESFAQYGVQPPHSCIVHNATEPSIFHPPHELLDPGRTLELVAVSWSENPRKGFSTLARVAEVPNVEVHFIGRWPESVSPGKVNRLGVLTAREIAKQMRQSNALIHAAENEPCSNTIIEALACGLPVLYKDSGSNREVAGDYGVELTENFAESIQILRSSYAKTRERVLRNRGSFLVEEAAKRYLQAFDQAIQVAGIG